MQLNFDRLIPRHETNAVAVEGYEGYLFGADSASLTLDRPREDIINMWVADMQFAALFGVSAFGTDLGLRIMEGLGLVAVT